MSRDLPQTILNRIKLIIIDVRHRLQLLDKLLALVDESLPDVPEEMLNMISAVGEWLANRFSKRWGRTLPETIRDLLYEYKRELAYEESKK